MRVLDGLSSEVEQGDFVAVVGPSGSGKSTLPPAGRAGCALRRRGGGRRRQAARAARSRAGPLPQLARGLRLPVLPPHPQPLRGGERAAALALRHASGRGASGPRPCWTGWGCCPRRTARRCGCPAASASAWPSPGRSSPARSCCCDEPTGNLDAATGAGVIQLFHELHREGSPCSPSPTKRMSSAARRVLLGKAGFVEPRCARPGGAS